MQHRHHKIISAWIENPSAWECFYSIPDLNLHGSWAWATALNPRWMPDTDYKIVKKEKKLTVPVRRYIYKLGPDFHIAHYYKGNLDPSAVISFVRWIDDDFITHEVETKEVEIVSLGTNSHSRNC